MTGLKILFVNRMAGLVRGGGETFDLEISRALEKLGCEVHYLTGAPIFGRPPLPIEHPNVHYIHSPYLPWFPWDKIKAGWRIKVWEFQWFERRAEAWIRKHARAFDVIQICELPYLVKRLQVSAFAKPTADKAGFRLRKAFRLRPPGYAGQDGGQGRLQEEIRPETRDLRLETTSNVQRSTFNVELSSGVPPDSSSQSKIQNPKSKIVLRLTAPNTYDRWGGIPLADALIASGTSIEKIKKSIRPDVVDVPNGVDLERFQPARVKNDGPPTLLYVARFQSFKNHALLIRAFQRVVESCPDVVLKLVGSGPLKGEVQKQVADAGLKDKVLFMGEVAHADLPAVNQAATIAVISSEYESFCFAAIEAMACGLPVVTTDCGWVPKLIGDELEPVSLEWATEYDPKDRFASNVTGEQVREVPGGMVVHRSDAESLARATVRMIGDAGLRDACGRWNRDKAEREHGWESSARRLLGVYERVAG